MNDLKRLTTTDELPIELECFLITWGFFESERAPGAIKHQLISKPKIKKMGVEANPVWLPSSSNQQPPF